LKKNILYYIAFLLCCYSNIAAQQIFIGVSTQYDDSFRGWRFAVDDEAFEGTLHQRWQMQNNWTEWDLEWANQNGYIRQKWKNDPSQWELRLDKDLVTMKTRWNQDTNEWIISDGNYELILSTRFSGQPQEWMVKKGKWGSFYIAMYYTDDPRDWEIEDNLKEEISDAMKIAISFVTFYHSSPKK
jgi:hypothetical protein